MRLSCTVEFTLSWFIGNIPSTDNDGMEGRVGDGNVVGEIVVSEDNSGVGGRSMFEEQLVQKNEMKQSKTNSCIFIILIIISLSLHAAS